MFVMLGKLLVNVDSVTEAHIDLNDPLILHIDGYLNSQTITYKTPEAAERDFVKLCKAAGIDTNENNANAALSAAAPDMYAALEDLMSAMDDVLYNADRVPDCIVAVAQDEMDKAKAALKKARGEA